MTNDMSFFNQRFSERALPGKSHESIGPNLALWRFERRKRK